MKAAVLGAGALASSISHLQLMSPEDPERAELRPGASNLRVDLYTQ